MASFHDANLTSALLTRAYLTQTNLSGANLSGADLILATIIESNLERANLTHCRVYGISAWDVRLEGAIQSNLVITPASDEAAIQVDNLEVAQFIYLLLNNEKVRHVIDTITSKVGLILGRFTLERKMILDAIREELRKRDYLPVLFDFEKPRALVAVTRGAVWRQRDSEKAHRLHEFSRRNPRRTWTFLKASSAIRDF